jgi:PAS domain-containing protein
MDGVVADWNRGVARIIGYMADDAKVKYPDSDWRKIRSHTRLYRDLPLMPQAEEMANLARRFRDELSWELVFLTAVPHKNDLHYAFYDKVIWGQRNFPDIPVHFGPYSRDKHVHCRPGDILIDDRSDNCEQWREAGGVAVQVDYDYYGRALKELGEILEKKLSLRRLTDLGSQT